MFIGHFAVGLGAKKVAPEINLGIFFIACQLLDLIWPVLVLAGIEVVSVDHLATKLTPLNFEHYPYSHSLLMTIVYSLVAGFFVGWVLKSKKLGVIVGMVTSSHWILDFVTHRPDMPILLSGQKVGLGLWNNLFLAVSIELLIFSAGIYLYLKSKTNMSQSRKIGFWSLIIFLLVIYLANVFGPKPPLDAPSAMIAGPALAMWLIVLWGYLVDRKTS
ncbi:MAG: hypothetical protein CL677_07765 [Bdellovibrionaceae bacterium]|nr:hypothetical protein [Pseudobdellovibrionaceae bacterium]|tara:strand:+ start:21904 stop:22554 length:651 start_codon:yes stop_codon:yes gene_type:complete